MTRNICVSAFIGGAHICSVQASEFDSISVGPPSRPSTETLIRQPSEAIMGMLESPFICAQDCFIRVRGYRAGGRSGLGKRLDRPSARTTPQFFPAKDAQ